MSGAQTQTDRQTLGLDRNPDEHSRQQVAQSRYYLQRWYVLATSSGGNDPKNAVLRPRGILQLDQTIEGIDPHESAKKNKK